MERKKETRESFLNDGLYKNTCQKLNIFVKNVKKSFLRGCVKIKNSVQMNVDINGCIGQLQKKGKQVKSLTANIVKKSFMFLDGKQKQVGESSVQKNVIGKINPRNIPANEIHNTKMDGLKEMGTFIFQLNGEKCESGFMNEIIMNVNSAESMADNCMPIISFPSEYAKTHLENQILSRCVESVINNIIVLNNRTGGENEFYK